MIGLKCDLRQFLNLVKKLVGWQFENRSDLCLYFELLPKTSQLKQGYGLMQEFPDGEQKRL